MDVKNSSNRRSPVGVVLTIGEIGERMWASPAQRRRRLSRKMPAPDLRARNPDSFYSPRALRPGPAARSTSAFLVNDVNDGSANDPSQPYPGSEVAVRCPVHLFGCSNF